ncbi:hypothetical protein [Thermoplasma sp.]|nr:hypothetical protein [Thermoplasma sp.]
MKLETMASNQMTMWNVFDTVNRPDDRRRSPKSFIRDGAILDHG